MAEESAETTADGDWLARPLVSCEHFTIFEWTALRESEHSFCSDELAVLMVIRGAGSIHWGETEIRTLAVSAGDTVLLPAGLATVDLRAEDDLTLLEVTPPRNE